MLEPEQLLQLANMKMPFGKYADTVLIDLPEEYLLWFQHKGFPKGKLGELMALALEIKVNGQESLLEPLRKEPRPVKASKSPRRIKLD